MKFLSIALLAISILFTSCKNNEASDSNTNAAAKSIEQRIDLAPFGLKADLLFPKLAESSSEYKIAHEVDGFDWQIFVDEKLFLTIEDLGELNSRTYYKERYSNLNYYRLSSDKDSLIQFENVENNTYSIIKLVEFDLISYGIIAENVKDKEGMTATLTGARIVAAKN